MTPTDNVAVKLQTYLANRLLTFSGGSTLPTYSP